MSRQCERGVVLAGSASRRISAYEHHRQGITFEQNISKQHLAFYTIFCGTGANAANQVHDPPSLTVPSYCFTDNNSTFVEADRKGWRAKLLDGEPSSDLIGANMKAKDLKARPFMNAILSQYNYTVFHDSKKMVQQDYVNQIVKSLPAHKAIAIREHNFIFPPVSVWTEFEESLKQERYVRQKTQMKHYIESKIRQGYAAVQPVHFWCSFIIRDMNNPLVRSVGNSWYSNIMECGIEDQISMFFVYQEYSEAFHPLSADVKLFA